MWCDRFLASRVAALITSATVVVLAASASRCTYPDFRYEDDGDGEGGSGAEGPGPVSSSSTGPPPAQVPCGVPSLLCGPAQVCCFHLTDETLDHCGDAMTCGPGFTEFSCNTKDDCPPQAALCCAKDNNLDGSLDVITCQGSCESVSEALLCGAPGDCASGVCEPVEYPGYQVCVE